MLKIKKKWLKDIYRLKNESKTRHKFLRLDKNEKIETLPKKKMERFFKSINTE